MMRRCVLTVVAALMIVGTVWAEEAIPTQEKPIQTQEAPVQTRAEAMAQAADFRKIVQDAKEKVFPAVVFIKCRRKSHESGKKVTQDVVGSGVIVTKTGEVISNWHVVDKAVEIRCLLSDGTSFEAEVIGTDKDTDLSLLRPKRAKPAAKKDGAKDAKDAPKDARKSDAPAKPARTDYPYAELGDSTVLKEGDFVMAMGAPFGLNRSVSIGIVSCTLRYLERNSEYSHWLQTDASISPGNSGGPLVNTDGKIIGINTRGSTGGGGDTGFSVPSATVEIIIKQLREHGKVNWSWTGLQLQPLRNFMKNIYFAGDQGVIVAEIEPGSPALDAKILKGDRIMAVNGKPLTALWSENLPSARRFLGMLPKDKPAKFDILRNNKRITISLTPRAKGAVEGKEQDCPRWNMTVKAINQFDNEALYFYRKQGVFVFGISPGNAANAGLVPEDIILKIGAKKVKTLKDVETSYDKAIENIDKKHRILFTVLRNGLIRQVLLDFKQDHEKQ